MKILEEVFDLTANSGRFRFTLDYLIHQLCKRRGMQEDKARTAQASKEETTKADKERKIQANKEKARATNE